MSDLARLVFSNSFVSVQRKSPVPCPDLLLFWTRKSGLSNRTLQHFFTAHGRRRTPRNASRHVLRAPMRGTFNVPRHRSILFVCFFSILATSNRRELVYFLPHDHPVAKSSAAGKRIRPRTPRSPAQGDGARGHSRAGGRGLPPLPLEATHGHPFYIFYILYTVKFIHG